MYLELYIKKSEPCSKKHFRWGPNVAMLLNKCVHCIGIPTHSIYCFIYTVYIIITVIEVGKAYHS